MSVKDTIFEWLAPPFEPGAAALRQRIQAEHAVGRQRPLARHGPLAAADPPGIGNYVMRPGSLMGKIHSYRDRQNFTFRLIA